MERLPRTIAAAAIIALFLVASSAYAPSSKAQSASSLAQTYAPVLQFASGEKFYPTSVDYIVSSSTMMLRTANGGGTLVNPAPTLASLGAYNSPDYYLNNKYGTNEAIAADYAARGQPQGYFAYVHVVSSGSGTVIQYWLWYAYNNGQLNDHQSDLEVVQIFLDSSGSPVQALYSQHVAGENAAWSDLELQNGHPVVYAALGSHANYFRAYQGRIGIENDIVNAGGLTIQPSQLKLVILDQTDPTISSWLSFPGRWGYTGTDAQIATGMAGPPGPVYNDGGRRWSTPYDYLAATLTVNSSYFYLAWFVANFLLIWFAYAGIRAVWKLFGIYRTSKRGGLRVGRFLKSKGGIGLAVGLIGLAITLGALFLPWYSVTATSANGVFSGPTAVPLMSVDGVHGLSLNLLTGPNADASSGLTSFASAQFPFAILFGVGIALLILDVIGVKSGKRLGRKFVVAAIFSMLPFVFIYAFVAYLPNLVPLASSLLGGQAVPPEVSQLVSTIASNPIGGSASQTFPVVGATTVVWGFGIGAYLFLVAAVVRIIGGFVIRRAPDLEQAAPVQATTVAGPATMAEDHVPRTPRSA